MKTYAVKLHGHIGVTAIVEAESPERAAAISWRSEDGMRPGETVSYEQGMTCYGDTPEIEDVYEVEAIPA